LINEDDKEAIVLRNRKRRNELKIKQDCKILKSDASSATVSDALKEQKVCVINGNDDASVQDLQVHLVPLKHTRMDESKL
jgi:hypothetical protein